MCTARCSTNMKVTNYFYDSVVIGRIILKFMLGRRLLYCKICQFVKIEINIRLL
jgi:hypothetical protein